MSAERSDRFEFRIRQVTLLSNGSTLSVLIALGLQRQQPAKQATA